MDRDRSPVCSSGSETGRQSRGAEGVGENQKQGAKRSHRGEKEPEAPLACELPKAGGLLFTPVPGLGVALNK